MNHRRTRDIVIELTSLLDVVMILIFAVMIENTRLMKQQEAEAGAARLEAHTALEELADVSSQNEALKSSRDELTAFYENELEALRNLSEQEKSDLLADIADLKGERETLSSENSELLSALEELQKKYEDQTEELLIALSKIDRMDIDELTARLQAAETAVKDYEYMEEVAVVIHVGLTSEMIGSKILGRITYGVGTGPNQALSRQFEYNPNGSQLAYETEKTALKKFIANSIDNAFANAQEEVKVHIIFTSSSDVTWRMYQEVFRAIKDVSDSKSEKYGNSKIVFKEQEYDEED